ncbi:purine-binding chemotaxis protein CheW [Candidatus Magnetomoraceae bacterium gMMP-1]
MIEETFQFCTFYLENFLFGVEANRVQEITQYQEITRVPLAPRAIKGLLNLRGQIVTALDLGFKLGLKSSQSDELSMNVVIRTSYGAVSFVVDEIGDVISVKDADFEPPPGTLANDIKRMIMGVYKIDTHQLIHVINIDKIIEIKESNSGTPRNS